MIGVVALPRLPCEVHGCDERQARGVVVDETGGREPFVERSVLRLVDASAGARALGVRPGMRILDAQRHAPMIHIDVVTKARLERELLVVAEVLLRCSPVVEPVPPATWSGIPMAAVALDLTGMVRPIERILVDVQRACARLSHAAVVVASPGTRLSLALARACAAAGRAAPLVVAPADVPRALAALPTGALEISADLAASLTALGIQTAADLARLLDKGAVERLGGEARAVLDALFARPAPLAGIRPPARIVEELDLEHPLDTLEPLSFVLRPMCQRLCVRVRAQRLRVAEVKLELRTRKRQPLVVAVAFPSPIHDDKALMRALTVRLERAALEDPVDGVVLEAARLARKGPQQLSLTDGATVKAEDALTGLLAEMAAEIGPARVGCLALTDESLPEKMTRLAWPPPPVPKRPPAPARRRPRKVPVLDERALTFGGRFLAAWPWPLRLLPRPARLARGDVDKSEPMGVLEGEDKADAPYARAYVLLVLKDGRRALGLVDEELEETWVAGWFD